MADNNGLLTKNADLSGRKIVVSETTYLMGIRRGQIISDILAEEKDTGKDAHIRQNVLTSVYAPLASCSAGDVPNKDEFLQMRESDVEAWIAVARELNPHLFEWMNDLEESLSVKERKAKAQKKVKRRKRLSKP